MKYFIILVLKSKQSINRQYMKFDLNYFKMMTSLLFKHEADFTTSTRYYLDTNFVVFV